MVSVLHVRLYRTASGSEPVREWLAEMGRPNKSIIGTDVKTVQFGWPLGMPLVRKLDSGLWQVGRRGGGQTRSDVPEGIARVIFTVDGGEMVLLHGFMKKSKKTSRDDLRLAKTRKKEALNGKA